MCATLFSQWLVGPISFFFTEPWLFGFPALVTSLPTTSRESLISGFYLNYLKQLTSSDLPFTLVESEYFFFFLLCFVLFLTNNYKKCTSELKFQNALANPSSVKLSHPGPEVTDEIVIISKVWYIKSTLVQMLFLIFLHSLTSTTS